MDLPAPRAEPVDADEVTEQLSKLIQSAATALGWDGTVVGPVTILGRRVGVIAELDPEVHAQRQASGWPPVVDRFEVAQWDWPELAAQVPAPAVRVAGVIAPAKHWLTGLFRAAVFARSWPTAVLLPRDYARICVPPAVQYRVGVLGVTSGEVDVLRECPRPPDRSWLPATERWALEVVYDALLTQPVREAP